MKNVVFHSLLLVMAVVLSACDRVGKNETGSRTSGEKTGSLLEVGEVQVDQADLDYHLKENHGGQNDEETRRKALDELANRARFVQAALDANLQNDPLVRAEMARLLENRLKEKSLSPALQAAASDPVSEARLRELYAAQESRFRSPEKRQVAVLWLNAKGDPDREKQYVEKLKEARDWVFHQSDLRDHPDKGFSVLGIDYSEHQASRYAGGIVGWMESAGGMDAWSKALADIVFSLNEPGEVSEVISTGEGVFLVRYVASQPAVLRPFESVSGELEQAEKQRLRESAETGFNTAIEQKYPVRELSR